MAKMPSVPIPIDPEILFRYAEAFAESVEMVSSQFKRVAQPLDADVVVPKHRLDISIAAATAPFMTLDTFSLELYFKCLYALDHGTLRWGHDIKAIYKSLKPHTRRRLRKNYARFAKDSGLIPTMEKRRRARFLNLTRYLDFSRYTFEEVRYLFERGKTKKRSLRYWPVLRQAARQSVLDIMPEWASKLRAYVEKP